MVLETLMWMPVLLLLISGTIQFGKATYLYYVLDKIVYSAARQISVQQGANFCDIANDPVTQAALQAAVNDPATSVPLISNLTADMLQVATQCLDVNGVPGLCDTSGCDGPAAAGQRPDFITVSIPGGYAVPLRIPFILLDPLSFKPSVTLPFHGSAL